MKKDRKSVGNIQNNSYLCCQNHPITLKIKETMKAKSWKALPLIAIAVITIWSCGGKLRTDAKASKADSLLYAAGNAKDYLRVLAIIDSLEDTGEISEMNTARWRGVANYYLGNMRSAEFHYKKAVAGEIRNEHDQQNYTKSARRLAGILTKKGDFQDAIQIATDALSKMEESKQGSESDYATLLNTIGCCQLNLGNPKSAAENFEKAYAAMEDILDSDSTGHLITNTFLNTTDIIENYLAFKNYKEALHWIDRADQLVQRYEAIPTTKAETTHETHGQTDLCRAIALQGLGEKKKADEYYRNAISNRFFKSAKGKLLANDYLMAAGRWMEAAENYHDLDRLLAVQDIDLTLDNIQQYLLPKYRANVMAHRRDSAIAVGTQICEALDSAIIRSRMDDAAELATIYDTHQKEAEIANQKADMSRQRLIGTATALILVIVFFTIYTLHRRKAQHHLAVAHTKLQAAYDKLEETTAAKERIESELRIARDIQMSMVPNLFPDREGLDMYASMVPAQEVGGDLYGYLMLGDELYFCLGDVSGKGVPASLFMAQATRLFRTLATQHMMPDEIATRMNAALSDDDNEHAMFVTMFIGLLDLNTGKLDFCNAGHNPPILMTKNETTEKGLRQTEFMKMLPNAPIGMWPGLVFKGETIESIKNRPLFVYTDGLNEAENKEQVQFSQERILNILRHTHFDNTRHVIQIMTDEVEKHRNGAEPNDDLTMMCLRIK